jgi:hypothetical protein
MSARRLARLAAVSLWLVGCDAQIGGVVEEDTDLTPAADSEPGPQDKVPFANYNLPIGAAIHVCHVYTGLNLRSGPSTDYMVLHVLSNGQVGQSIARSGNWYKWTVDGRTGWSYGDYLCSGGAAPPSPAPAPAPPDTSSPSPGINVSRDGIINAAKAFVGFSYWWGGAAFKIGSHEFGKCYGYSYSAHSGHYGGDCSGYVGKVWQLPEAMPFEAQRHAFSTYHFYNQSNHWSSISRGAAKRADAMVYNSGSAGHILIFESGDAWGQAWTYESRNCPTGVVHNLRSISSDYRARHRDGV